jgi:hypothetical protein
MNTALETILDAIHTKPYSSQAEADIWGLFDATARTQKACNNGHEERLTHLYRFKYKKLLSGEERVAENFVYSRFFDTQIGERNAHGVDGLLAAIEDKRIEVSMHAAANAQASLYFRHHPR